MTFSRGCVEHANNDEFTGRSTLIWGGQRTDKPIFTLLMFFPLNHYDTYKHKQVVSHSCDKIWWNQQKINSPIHTHSTVVCRLWSNCQVVSTLVFYKSFNSWHEFKLFFLMISALHLSGYVETEDLLILQIMTFIEPDNVSGQVWLLLVAWNRVSMKQWPPLSRECKVPTAIPVNYWHGWHTVMYNSVRNSHIIV